MTRLFYKKTRTTLHVLMLTLLFAFQAKAQCPPGGYVVTTQAEVNQFIIDYPNCTEINGDFQIGNAINLPPGNITDLSPLGNITHVEGNVYIQNNALLQNVDGLNISTIGGWLYVGGDEETRTNLELLNLNGLSSLTSVAHDIYINYNHNLNDISGLQNTIFNPFQGYGLTINQNPLLAVCNLPNFCAYLANPASTHPRVISGNLAECINEQAVIDACNALPTCPPGGYVVTTQAEVNQFIIDYPNCTEIAGDLIIGSQVQNLNGLSNITTITGSIDAQDATSLTDISGLSNLTTVGQGIQITNTALTNLNGFNNLTSIGALLRISDNPALTSINGFATLISVGGGFDIGNNAVLTNINSFSTLNSVGGYFNISYNAALTNINGFGVLNSVNSVGGDFYIGNNAVLTNIDGFGALNSVGGYLGIENNVALTNLNAFSALASVGEHIYIVNNAVLSDISTLQNTTFNPANGYGLTILNNPALAVCNLPNFCAYLANPANTHPRFISGNLANCVDEAAVVADCKTSPIKDIAKINISVYPNPVKETLYFSEEVSNIKITDILGRIVKQFSVKNTLVDVSQFSKGIYILSATTQEGKTFTKKIIKE